MDENGEYIRGLFKLVTSDASIPKIVNFASKSIGNPILVTDTDLDFLAKSKDMVDDRLWSFLATSTSERDADIYSKIRAEKSSQDMQDSAKPVISEFSLSKHRYLDAKIVHSGTTLGVVHIIEYNRKFIEKDKAMAQDLARAIASLMMFKGAMGSKSLSSQETALRCLLTGRSISKGLVEDKLFKLIPNYNYIVVLAEDADGLYRESTLLAPMLDLLSGRFLIARSIVYEERIVILAQVPIRDSAMFFNWSRFKKTLESQKLRATVSDPFEDFYKMKTYYLQTLNALELGKRFANGEALIHYEDVGLYSLFDYAKDYIATMPRFPQLLKLLDYDKTNNTHYFKDLFVFLQNNCNIRKTAEALSVHKNTVSYRINRISEIMGNDIQDGKFLFRLQLAIKILYYQDAMVFSEKYGISKDELSWPVI